MENNTNDTTENEIAEDDLLEEELDEEMEDGGEEFTYTEEKQIGRASCRERV